MEKNFVCIACPMGCQLKVWEENGEVHVSGNTCRRGLEYGKQEFSAPQRTVTSSVAVAGRQHVLCSVKTDVPVPKEKVQDVLKAVYAIRAQAPLRVGDVLLQDVCGTGANIVATRNVD